MPSINADCYDCQNYINDNCGGKPDRCSDYQSASSVETPTEVIDKQTEGYARIIKGEKPKPPVRQAVNTLTSVQVEILSPKQQNFDRLKTARLEKFAHEIKLLGNLVGPNYKPTVQQVNRLCTDIGQIVDRLQCLIQDYVHKNSEN